MMGHSDGRSIAESAQELTEDELHAARDQIGPCNDEGFAITGFAYPFDNPIFYVKFGNRRVTSMTAEAATQQFVFDALEKMPPEPRRGIHVPQIFRVLTTHRGVYIVMELVSGRRLDQLYETIDCFEDISKPYYDQIARGIKLLLSIPVPPDAKPGPCGNSVIKHPFFKDSEAPIQYDSVDILEEHINNLATWFDKSAPKVTLQRELHVVYSDLYEGNFMFTDAGDMYIIDFEHVAFLPISFQDFAIRSPSVMSTNVAGYIEDQFDLPQENLAVMNKVSGLMLMSGRNLGVPGGPYERRVPR